MFFFVLEFLFYAFIILLGLGLILQILASDAFWIAAGWVVLIALLAGLVSFGVWGVSALENQTVAIGLSGISGALLGCAARVVIVRRRIDTDWFVRALTGLVVAAAAAWGAAYLIWQDETALVGTTVGGFVVMALLIGLIALRRGSQPGAATAHPPKASERPRQDYKYEKVP